LVENGGDTMGKLFRGFLALILMATSGAAVAKEMPVEAFAALPSFSQARLSPDGTKIAYSVSLKGRKHVVVQTLDGQERKLIAPSKDWELNSYRWANENTVIVNTGSLLNRREFAHKTYNTRLLSFIVDEGKYVWLGKPKAQSTSNVNRNGLNQVSQLERVLDYLPNDPKNILMELDYDLDGNVEVFRVNVKTGKRKKVKKEVDGVQDWYTDQSSEIRFGTGYKGANYDQPYAIFKGEDGKWASLRNAKWRENYEIRGFTDEPGIVYVSGITEYGTTGLFKLDISTGQIVDKIFSNEKVDFDYVTHDSATGKAVGVAYTDDFSRKRYFDKNYRTVQRSMDHAFKGAVTSIIGRAKDKQLYLIYVESDTNPGQYYFFDRSAKQVHFIAEVREKIDVEQTASTIKLSIPVRDGSEIPAYLTAPKGVKISNLPTIILPHGGPHARDDAEWDFWAQFYANRGYLVLKPNFRGSTGYGRAYEDKGVLQWGGLMQDDVIDATKWLIAEGKADPERICIVGASYGGYAALMGVIMEPGLYRCAVSINGVTNLPLLKNDDKSTIGGNVWIKRMGLKGKSDKSVSPYHHIEEVSAPILLMSSKDDQRVPYLMSSAMDKQLRKQKKSSKYVRIENGGHSMVTEKARLTMLRETEKFLAKHIGN